MHQCQHSMDIKLWFLPESHSKFIIQTALNTWQRLMDEKRHLTIAPLQVGSRQSNVVGELDESQCHQQTHQDREVLQSLWQTQEWSSASDSSEPWLWSALLEKAWWSIRRGQHGPKVGFGRGGATVGAGVTSERQTRFGHCRWSSHQHNLQLSVHGL